MSDLTALYFALSGLCATPALIVIGICIVLLTRIWLREECKRERLEAGE